VCPSGLWPSPKPSCHILLGQGAMAEAAQPDIKEEQPLKVGDFVRAKWGSRWCNATIKKVGTETVTVQYEYDESVDEIAHEDIDVHFSQQPPEPEVENPPHQSTPSALPPKARPSRPAPPRSNVQEDPLPAEQDQGWDTFWSATPPRRRPPPEVAGPPRGAEGTPPVLPMNEERISHVLARTLRYHLGEHGLQADGDGFIAVQDILEVLHEELPGVTEDRIRRVAETSMGSRGKRFDVRRLEVENGSSWEIRALYRHPPEGYLRRERHERRERRMRDRDVYGRTGGPPPQPLHGHWNGRFAGRGGADEPRRAGFSDPLPYDQEEEDAPPASRPPAAHRVPSGRGVVAPATSGNPAVQAAPAEAEKPQIEDAADAEQQESTEAGDLESEAPRACVWERYTEPETNRVWFWNASTEEVFFADETDSGWMALPGTGDDAGRVIWFHAATGNAFFEDEAS